MVGTTGEPLPNEIKYLQKSAGKMCSLNRNGYFKPGPHLRRIGLLIKSQPRPKQIQYHDRAATAEAIEKIDATRTSKRK